MNTAETEWHSVTAEVMWFEIRQSWFENGLGQCGGLGAAGAHVRCRHKASTLHVANSMCSRQDVTRG